MKKNVKQKSLVVVKHLEIELEKNQLAKKISAISRQNQLLKDALIREQLNMKQKHSYPMATESKYLR